ncbi:unnamed protein product, partial [marine sediment metagenome]
DGLVKEVSADKIIIENTDNIQKEYILKKFVRSNQ